MGFPFPFFPDDEKQKQKHHRKEDDEIHAGTCFVASQIALVVCRDKSSFSFAGWDCSSAARTFELGLA